MGRVNHGTAHLPWSRRRRLTAQGDRDAAAFLGFDTPSDFVRAYPMSGQWLTLLIRRIGAVASVYRLAALASPVIGRPQVHRVGSFTRRPAGRADQSRCILPPVNGSLGSR